MNLQLVHFFYFFTHRTLIFTMLYVYILYYGSFIHFPKKTRTFLYLTYIPTNILANLINHLHKIQTNIDKLNQISNLQFTEQESRCFSIQHSTSNIYISQHIQQQANNNHLLSISTRDASDPEIFIILKHLSSNTLASQSQI